MGKDELEFLKKKIKEAEEAADKIKETATDVVEDVTGLTESDQAAAESAEKDAMDEDLAKEGYMASTDDGEADAEA